MVVFRDTRDMLFNLAFTMSSEDETSRENIGSESDVVKKGFLHVKRPPTHVKLRLKTWQKRYFVLRDDSHDRGTRLELYNCEGAWADRKLSTEQCTIDLASITCLEDYKESKSFPFAFTITRKGQAPLVVGTDTELEKQQWMVAIRLLAGKSTAKDPPRSRSVPVNLRPWDKDFEVPPRVAERDSFSSSSPSPKSPTRLNHDQMFIHGCGANVQDETILYHRYRVQVQATEASRLNKLYGDCDMYVSATDVVLCTIGAKREHLISWPLKHIVKFKSEELSSSIGGGDLVTLEGGVACDLKEGEFLFKSQFGKELIRRVRDSVKRLSSKRSCETYQHSNSDRHSLPVRTTQGKSCSDPCLSDSTKVVNQFWRAPESDRMEVSTPPNNEDEEYHSYLQVLPDTVIPEETSTTSGIQQKAIGKLRKDSGFEEDILDLNKQPPLPCRRQTMPMLCSHQMSPVHLPVSRGSTDITQKLPFRSLSCDASRTPPELPSRRRRVTSPNIPSRSETKGGGDSVADRVNDGQYPTPPPPPPRPRHTLTNHSSFLRIPDRPLPPLPTQSQSSDT